MKLIRRKTDPVFPFKLWFTTVVVGNILSFVVVALLKVINSGMNFWAELLPFLGSSVSLGIMVIGIILSLPILALYILALNLLLRFPLSIAAIKTLLTISGVILIFSTFIVLIPEFFYDTNGLMAFIHSIVLIILTSIFKLQETSKISTYPS